MFKLDYTADGHRHDAKTFLPVIGEVPKAWELGKVWKAPCGRLYGVYYNRELFKFDHQFLGRNEEQALDRMKHVKSFIM